MTESTDPQDAARLRQKRYPQLDTCGLAKVIEAHCRELDGALAIVHANAELLHESYRYEDGEPDLGYCCDVVRAMLKDIVIALIALTRTFKADSHADRIQLAKTLETRRQTLFQVQALAKLIGYRLRTHDFGEHNAPDLSLTFASVDQTLDKALNALEPLCLGLPIPVFDGECDEATSER